MESSEQKLLNQTKGESYSMSMIIETSISEIDQKRSFMNEAMDSSLFSLLTTSLNLDDCLKMMRLSKQYNHYLTKAPEVLDFIWKKQFEYEYVKTEYPDHHIL